MACGDEVTTYLAASGLGLTAGSLGANGIFAGPFPPETTTNTNTCVIEYGGMEPVDAMGPSLAAPIFEQVRFQVLCRDSSDNLSTCRALANSIYKKLRHYSGAMGGVNYAYVKALGPVFFLKFDENNRGYYACNFEARKAES